MLLSLVVPRPAVAGPSASELLKKYECHRCHDGAGIPEAGPDEHCVRCHSDIVGGRSAAEADVMAEWKDNIRSYTASPSLKDIGRVMRREWVQDYLQRPFDVRPGLRGMMPLVSMSEAEARVLAEHLVPDEEEPPLARPSDEMIERGRELYARYRCYQCHEFSAARMARAKRTPYASTRTLKLAPDLRYARERMRPEVVAQWIARPTALRPTTAMPNFGVKAADAEAMAAFVLYAPLKPWAPRSRIEQPKLERKVTFEEVYTKVFRKACSHCHADSDPDKGPAGHFGLAVRGLDLSSEKGIAAGIEEPDGSRTSVLAPGKDGVSLLVSSLRARVIEAESADHVDGVRGMPLGLPPLSEGEIRLVAAWIEQMPEGR